MTHPSGKFRIRRRGALLLIIASIALASPITGPRGMAAFAKDNDDGGNRGDGGRGDNDRDGGRGDKDRDSDSDNDSDSDSDSDNDSDNDSDSDDGDDGGSGSDGSNGGSSGSSGKGSSGSASGASKSGSRSQPKDGALATRLKGRIAPIREIEALVGRVTPGEIIDVRLYSSRDRYIYRVTVIQRNGSIYDVRVDAVSRKVLSKRER